MDAAAQPYRVLARKYRPQTFADLIGQEALVRTLTNAFATGRIAHAFLLTGVRGVGKTTTARIVARGLNCIGPDGTGGPTPHPCGVCEPCQSIAADRQVDVMEMDAASRTGVNDIREIIDGVRFRPVSARFKVYIIDEVHMLSTNAFNALLKTLEEPPEHTKFIFATTELRKVPITVLSRCQKFELRRIGADELQAHFGRIVAREGVTIEDEALRLIARAADGSARDGLSLLDQAIALSAGEVKAQAVREMLGLADRSRLFDLFEAVMAADLPAALAQVDAMHARGASPVVVAQDLLELTHTLTRLKVVKATDTPDLAGEAERGRGADLAARLSVAHLSRTWQMLLKGLGEVQQAPDARAALEMVLIRLAYTADLPTPGEALTGSGQPVGGGRPAGGGGGGGSSGGGARAMGLALATSTAEPMATVAQLGPAPTADPNRAPMPKDFPSLVELVVARREPQMAAHLKTSVHLVRFQPGRLEVRPTASAPSSLLPDLAQRLSAWTGDRWLVIASKEPGAPTLAAQQADARAGLWQEVSADPLVRAVLEAFPGAKIDAVRALAQADPDLAIDDPPPPLPPIDAEEEDEADLF
ncbi:MAG: DNA polymerase III subunit gamma/tau [Alphaproteobacteria bacterium]|nr:MAG: DNA polymerase III subunit gamma/tau [Alphaproteobacteria bacterium]